MGKSRWEAKNWFRLTRGGSRNANGCVEVETTRPNQRWDPESP
jgi:hypothetical protein